jgi:hypothetical protein
MVLAIYTFSDIVTKKDKGGCMKAKTKFYGYRAVKKDEDKRILRLKRAVGCKSTTKLIQLGLEKLEEIFLPPASTNR